MESKVSIISPTVILTVGKPHKAIASSSGTKQLSIARRKASTRSYDRASGLWIEDKSVDTISRNERATVNCAVLAAQEASALKPLEFSHEENEEARAGMFLRDCGINHNSKITF